MSINPIYRWATRNRSWEHRLEYHTGLGWTIKGLNIGCWHDLEAALVWIRRFAQQHGWVELPTLWSSNESRE